MAAPSFFLLVCLFPICEVFIWSQISSIVIIMDLFSELKMLFFFKEVHDSHCIYLRLLLSAKISKEFEWNFTCTSLWYFLVPNPDRRNETSIKSCKKKYFVCWMPLSPIIQYIVILSSWSRKSVKLVE